MASNKKESNSVNEYMYTCFVDLLTQVCGYTSSPQGDYLTDHISYHIVGQILDMLKEGMNEDFWLLPCGSTLEGMCVPETKIKSHGKKKYYAERYDSDYDYMVGVDVVKFISNLKGSASHPLEEMELSVNDVLSDDCFQHGGFCYLKLPKSIPPGAQINNLSTRLRGENFVLSPVLFSIAVAGITVGPMNISTVQDFQFGKTDMDEENYAEDTPRKAFDILSYKFQGPALKMYIDRQGLEDDYCSFAGPAYGEVQDSVEEIEDFESDSEHSNLVESKEIEFTHEELDFVPFLHIPVWPKVADKWCSRKRNWPSKEIVDKVMVLGFHCVTCKPHGWVSPVEGQCLLWRMSFSRAEMVLLQSIPNKAWCKHTCRIVKYVLKRHFANPKGVLSSYLIKTVFFWTLEDYPPELWTNQNMDIMFKLMIKKLIHSFASRHLPHYFLQNYNLLEAVNREFCQEVLKKLIKVYNEPMKYLIRQHVEPWDDELAGMSIEEMLQYCD